MDVLERRAGWLESAAVVAFCEDGFTGVNHAGDVLHGFVSVLTPIIIYWLCAIACQADCIVTRNVGHFADSPVPAITPEDLLIEFGDRDL